MAVVVGERESTKAVSIAVAFNAALPTALTLAMVPSKIKENCSLPAFCEVYLLRLQNLQISKAEGYEEVVTRDA